MKELEPREDAKVSGGTDETGTTAELGSTATSLPSRCVLEIDPLPPDLPVKPVQA